jgi:hypothetical protein
LIVILVPLGSLAFSASATDAKFLTGCAVGCGVAAGAAPLSVLTTEGMTEVYEFITDATSRLNG